MEVLILVGGCKNGHTDTLCGHLTLGLPEGFSVNRLNVSSMDISHCTGCNTCASRGACVHKDDMMKVIESFDRADIVLFATPVRFNGPSSQIKTVLDRFQLLWNSPDLVSHRKRLMGLLMTSGSDNPDVNPNLKVFRSFCASFGGVWTGNVILKGTDSGDVDYDACARSMVDQIVSSVNAE